MTKESNHVKLVRSFVVALGCALVAACGGSGGSGSSAPPVVVTVTPTPVPSTTGIARVTITEPVVATSATRRLAQVRRPSHVPASTQMIAITVNGTLVAPFVYDMNSPTCVAAGAVRTCTYDVTVPAGNDTIVVQALNRSNKVLATTTVQQVIAGTTVVPIVLAGVPSSARVKFTNNSAPAGTPTSVPLTVTAYDADGNPISGTYALAISLTDSDTSGHTSVAPSTVPASTTTVALTTDGKAVNAKISTGGSVTSGGDVFATAIAAHEYAIPSGQVAAANTGTGSIVLGGDGAMWFGEQNGIGRIDTAGTITEYPMAQPQQIVRGADGAVWFTSSYDRSTGVSGALIRVGSGGAVSRFGANLGWRIAVGADNNFWLIDGNPYVTRVTPSGTITKFNLTVPTGTSSSTTDIVSGPDGNLWIFDGYGRLYTVSTSGTQLATTTLSPPPTSGLGGSRMTFGADGALWMTTQTSVLRVTTSGATTDYNQLPGFPYSNGYSMAPIISASDGNVWTAGSWSSQQPALFRLTTAGAAIVMPLPAPPAQPSFGGIIPNGIANGPNGTIWYVRGNSVGWFTTPS